jgi:putative ATP-dependent endonuclease of OLD family
VDVSIVPRAGKRFEEAVAALFGGAVRRDASDREVVAMRTIGSLGADRISIDTRRVFIEGWSSCDDTPGAEIAGQRVTERHLALVAFALLDADRDLVKQLRLRQSPWGQLLARLDLPDAVISDIEAALSGVGAKVVGESAVLRRLRDQLIELQKALATIATVRLEPVPVRIDELARAIDVVIAAPGSPELPLRLQGLGSRSLAELMVFRVFADTLTGLGEALRPQSVSCFEEPEAHLHPQAELAIARLIDGMPGQRIITTHSPQLASEVNLNSVRLFRRSGTGVEVRRPSRLSEEDLVKVRRLAERPYGQVLFARLVIIADGATERGALPVFARAYWDGTAPEGKCVTIVDPESLGNAGALVKMLEDLGIPWLILADGDKAAATALNNIGGRIKRTLDATSPEVVMLPDGQSFERYLLDQGLRPQIEQAIAGLYGPTALSDFRSQPGNSSRDEDDLVLKFLKEKKGSFGQSVAEAIIATPDENGSPTIPGIVRQLFERADQMLGGVTT